jgi:hypothetical protein
MMMGTISNTTSNTTASAMAKVLKERGGIDALAQSGALKFFRAKHLQPVPVQ